MRNLFRPVAVLATGAVIATTLSAPAQAAPDDLGAGWLQRQLTDGLIVGEYQDTWTDPDNPSWVKYNDYGLTADVGLALDYIKGYRAVRPIARALDDHVDSWTTGADFGAPDDIYAGSVAKAVVLAQSAERDPRDFGGINLVQRLNARVSDTAPYVGRIEDQGASDYANTLGQSFAAVGLADAGSDRAKAVRSFLMLQQCDAGWFRLNFSAKDAPDQSCDADPTSTADTDATALAVLALRNAAGGPRVQDAIQAAARWLKRTQRENGSFGGGTSTEAPNSNSTGLAAWALGDAGYCRPATRAARWVLGMQLRGDVAGTPLAGERGAIAYNRAAKKAAQQEGITRETRDQWRRATAQAAPSLRFAPGCVDRPDR